MCQGDPIGASICVAITGPPTPPTPDLLKLY